MRTTDRLQVLMDFYHAMVPAAAALAPGVFLYCGERVLGEQTPAGIGMKDWDRIYAVPTVRYTIVRSSILSLRRKVVRLRCAPDGLQLANISY
jgi:hypothetical protein